MIREIVSGQRQEDGLNRRWFSCGVFDLYVWKNHDNGLVKFQICEKPRYSIPPEEPTKKKVLTWRPVKGFEYGLIADTQRYLTPILESTEAYDTELLRHQFMTLSVNMDSHTRGEILRHLSTL
ncbi:MAG: hypothetical protein ACI845_001682 [Gammaproteobacteria bacterium]|jgi:hypothetical protein